MNKFCGNCGTKTVKGKCPNCDVIKEEKKVETKVENKVVESDGAAIGWGILGFFFPLVGLILFLAWLNTKKKSSKAAGIGALVGFVVGIFIFLTSIAWFVRFIQKMDEPNIYNPSIYDIGDNDNDNDVDDDDNTEYDLDVAIKDIDASKNFEKYVFTEDSLIPIVAGKEYNENNQGFKLVLNNRKLSLIDDATGEVYDSIDNVDKAYYHTVDCSGWDSIIVYSGTDIYYANPHNFSYLNVKFTKLKYSYKSFAIVHNLAWTCGGDTITLGVTESAKGDDIYYDLDTETIFSKDTYHYYKDNKNYILTTRSFRFEDVSGTAKLVIRSSVSDEVLGVINYADVAYDLTNPSSPRVGKVTRVTVKDEVTTLYLEDGTTHTFNYSEIEY